MGQAWGRIPQALIPAGQQDRLCPNSPGAPLVFSILVANCTNGHGIQTKLSALQMGRSKLRPPPGKSSPQPGGALAIFRLSQPVSRSCSFNCCWTGSRTRCLSAGALAAPAWHRWREVCWPPCGGTKEHVGNSHWEASAAHVMPATAPRLKHWIAPHLQMRKLRHGDVKRHAPRVTPLAEAGSNPGTADPKTGAPKPRAH